MSQTATHPRSIAAAALIMTAVTASFYTLWKSEKRRRLRRIVRFIFLYTCGCILTWSSCNSCLRTSTLGECLEILTKRRRPFGRIYTIYLPAKQTLHFGRISNMQFLGRPIIYFHYQADLLMVHPVGRTHLQLAPSRIFTYLCTVFVTAETISSVTRSDVSAPQNPLTRVGRTRDGHDIVIRVIVIGNEGHEHLKILRKIATGEHSLYSTNHALPMFSEFQFEDIVFGFFPKVAGTLGDAYKSWPKNSVGDIVDMITQMLEVCVTAVLLLECCQIFLSRPLCIFTI